MSMPAMQINSTPTLADLLQGFAVAPAVPVTGIASDSRRLKTGDVFLATAGETSHGLDFLQQAEAAGVTAVVFDAATAAMPADAGVPVFAVLNLANHLGEIANRFYGHPSQQLKTIAVTGTNGKTTVAWLLQDCLGRLEQRCGYVGTLGFGIESLEVAAGLTTPAVVELHEVINRFVIENASHAAIEVSSHALSQGRVDGLTFDAVLFTNLTRDHLDYHGDMRSYFESKATLFTDYPATHKIVCVDSEYGEELAARCGDSVVRVSRDAGRVDTSKPHVLINAVAATNAGLRISANSSWGAADIQLPLVGDFNVDNAALVLAYLLASGIAIGEAAGALELVTPPPGRMQKLSSGDADIYVDYAHTPDALESALRALRPHCSGQLWCVFGCGGDRDTGKRPEMGRIADRLADRSVVTSDNPRNEDPKAIVDAVVAGFATAPDVLVDRAAAITYAIEKASAGDVVLIAGKGHEDYQEVAGERRFFSDAEVASAAAAEGGA